MHPNAALVQRFYDAFAAGDAEAMVVCYHPEVVFSDPVFGELRGEDARDMWRMLFGRAKDLSVRVSDVRADDEAGSARWLTDYRFGKAQRRVRNAIDARFRFRDGLIVAHRDSFGLWRWSRQALGPLGLLLGWSPLVGARVRRQALAGLRAFQARRA